MENNAYRLFINQVVKLAETIVIKSTDAATSINRFVSGFYGTAMVDKYDPTTWKYYKNLAGEYHPIDEEMTVVSLDTRETIIFAKETLAVHRATARGYAYGSRHYKELVSRFPKQETLILGILYPVDKDEAIAANDGAILGYPADLVESNEYSLISNLQNWIDGYIKRWVNSQYNYTDPLYAATWMGIMYINLVPAILTFRLEACKTNEAHSFHVKQYLASHGIDESYTEMLTLKQSLWLYRNICYIERNTGTQENFEWLMEHLLTERRLPLAEYTMRHDISVMPDNLYPELKFRKKTLNMPVATDGLQSIGLQELLNKEDKFGRSNAKVKADEMPRIQEAMENSKSNVLMTKFLESSMVDRTNNTPYTMNDILMNHWLYLSSSGQYTAFIGVPDPKTGERIPLTVKDAFVFVWYAFCKANGLDIEQVPRMYATRVQRFPVPSTDELMKIVDASILPRSVAEEARSYTVDIGPLISTEAFYNTCADIYAGAQKQRRLVSMQENPVGRGMAFGMVSHLYSDYSCPMVQDETESYAAWFNERSIPIDQYSLADLGLLYVNIIREATGLALTTKKSLKDLQKAMLRIMASLCSYSVQFNAEINSSDLLVTDWTAIRLGNMSTKGFGLEHDQNHVVGVQDVKVKGYTEFDVEVLEPAKGNSLVVRGHSNPMDIEVATAVRFDHSGMHSQYNLDSASVRVNVYPPLKPNSRHIFPVVGIDAYLQLPLAQQLDFADMYGSYIPKPPELNEPVDDGLKLISATWTITSLSGLVYDNTKP